MSARWVVTYSPEPEGFPVFRWQAPSTCTTAVEAVEAFESEPDGDGWYCVKAVRS